MRTTSAAQHQGLPRRSPDVTFEVCRRMTIQHERRLSRNIGGIDRECRDPLASWRYLPLCKRGESGGGAYPNDRKGLTLYLPTGGVLQSDIFPAGDQARRGSYVGRRMNQAHCFSCHLDGREWSTTNRVIRRLHRS